MVAGEEKFQLGDSKANCVSLKKMYVNLHVVATYKAFALELRDIMYLKCLHLETFRVLFQEALGTARIHGLASCTCRSGVLVFA